MTRTLDISMEQRLRNMERRITNNRGRSMLLLTGICLSGMLLTNGIIGIPLALAIIPTYYLFFAGIDTGLEYLLKDDLDDSD